MDMKLIALTAAVAAATAVGVRAARAATGDDSAPAPELDAQAATPDIGPVVVPPPSEKALRYYRGGNVIWVVEQFLGLALPLLFLFTGFSATLRTLASSLGRGRFYPTLVIYLCAFSLVTSLIQLPLSYYVGYVREHTFGLSTQHLSKWIGDQVKGALVGLVIGALILWLPYLLLARSPSHWWLWTGILSLPLIVIMFLITPIWIAPLFNKFGPMQDKALEADVLATASRAGVEGARVFQVDKSVDTEKVNAYVTGIGNTKRIVLWDTLLKRLSPRQIRFVVGHELGHYVLGHVVVSIFVSWGLLLLGLYGAHRTADLLLSRFGGRFGFSQLSDVASLPLLMLLLSVFSLLIGPATLALSRYHEHEADRFALELTHDNPGGASAFVALQRQNLAVPRPGWLFKLFRASHPPIGERVDFMNTYRPWARGERERYIDHVRR
jgi:Zn-dependent protease with chaperone function